MFDFSFFGQNRLNGARSFDSCSVGFYYPKFLKLEVRTKMFHSIELGPLSTLDSGRVGHVTGRVGSSLVLEYFLPPSDFF